MRVAVVGGGISGNAAAHAWQEFADVTLFEAQPRLGGHTVTHNLLVDHRAYAVDSGFYRHPVFSPGAHAAQIRVDRISWRPRTLHCGAWRGWGLHEGGFRSGVEAAGRLRRLSAG